MLSRDPSILGLFNDSNALCRLKHVDVFKLMGILRELCQTFLFFFFFFCPRRPLYSRGGGGEGCWKKKKQNKTTMHIITHILIQKIGNKKYKYFERHRVLPATPNNLLKNAVWLVSRQR